MCVYALPIPGCALPRARLPAHPSTHTALIPYDRVGDLLESSGRARDAIPVQEVEALVKNAYALQVRKPKNGRSTGLLCVPVRVSVAHPLLPLTRRRDGMLQVVHTRPLAQELSQGPDPAALNEVRGS